MSTTNPTDKQTIVAPLFDAALAARNAGELEKAKSLCIQALHLLDNTDRKLLVVLHGEIGYIHRLLDDLTAAIHHYECALQAGPKSELASLGLFHSLIDQGEWNHALEEVVRFLKQRDSTEYRELLVDGFEDGLPPKARSLAKEARALLSAYKSE